MFGRQPKEKNLSTSPEVEDMIFSPPTVLDEEGNQDDMEINLQAETGLTNKSTVEQPEVVNVVEKISGILSPYFIVLVGLFLYEDNVFIGIFLITIGMLSILKISWKDIGDFVEKLKKLLGLTDQNPS